MAGRAWRAGWLAAAGLLVAAVVGCGGGGPLGGGSSMQGEDGPAVVSTDGRVLTVPEDYGQCGTVPTLVAQQGTDEVALWVREDVPGSVTIGCDRGSLPLRVRLAAPLGNRKLVDGATGRRLAQFSARLLLRPRVLPPGYRLWQVWPRWYVPSDGHAVVYVRLIYSRQTRAYQEDFGHLTIAENPDTPFVPGPWHPGVFPSDPPGTWTPIRVRGVPGWAARGSIAWRQHGLLYMVSIDSGAPPLPALLSTAQLIAIADSA
jgi:hypothetical protein